MMPATIHHERIANTEEPAMDLLLALLILITSLAALGYAALRWGVDTRPCLPDDHRR
jgi:hypothetical protein